MYTVHMTRSEAFALLQQHPRGVLRKFQRLPWDGKPMHWNVRSCPQQAGSHRFAMLPLKWDRKSFVWYLLGHKRSWTCTQNQIKNSLVKSSHSSQTTLSNSKKSSSTLYRKREHCRTPVGVWKFAKTRDPGGLRKYIVCHIPGNWKSSELDAIVNKSREHTRLD